MTKPKFQTFDPAQAEDPGADQTRLAAQLDQHRQAWLEDRDKDGGPDPDVADAHQQAMNELRAARLHWRQIGEATGARPAGGIGAAVVDNTDD